MAATALLILGGRPYAWLPERLEAILPAVFYLLATAPLFAAFSQEGGWLRMTGVSAVWVAIGCGWLCWLDPVFGIPCWLAVVVLGTVHFAPVGWLLARLRRRWGVDRMLWWAPVAWAGWEWARSHPPACSPWFSLGHGLWKLPVLCQLAELTGVTGLSLVMATVGAGLARLLLGRRDDRLQLAVGAGLVLGLVFYGVTRMQTIDCEAGEPVKVACVQPDVAQELKRTLDGGDMLLDVLDLTATVPQGTQLVVWPETAATLYVDSAPAKPYVAEAARDGRFTLVAGGFHRSTGEGWSPVRTNAAVIYGPDGGLLGVYNKVRLVLMGEYLPWRQYKLVRPLAEKTPQFFAGRGFLPVDTPAGRLGVAICYESVFPGDCRALTRAGAELLVVMTNDDQLQQSGAREHYQQAVFRCIENRRWMARCANGGISAVVDPLGRVTTASQWNQRTVLPGTVYRRHDRSPMVRWGEWFGAVCLLVSVAAAFWPSSPRAADPE